MEYEIETSWRGHTVTVSVMADARPVKKARELMAKLEASSVRIWLLKNNVKYQVYDEQARSRERAQP